MRFESGKGGRRAARKNVPKLKHVIKKIRKLSLDKDSEMDVRCLSVFGGAKTGCDSRPAKVM
jgi:hypothetical protein